MLCTVKSALQGLCQQVSAEFAGEVETSIAQVMHQEVTATPLCAKVTVDNNQTKLRHLSSAVNTTEPCAAA